MGALMTTNYAAHPLARFIEAVKGVGKLADYLTAPRPGEAVKLLPEAGEHCRQGAPAGYRCIVRAPHAQCVVEKVR